jgi:hypothetical protein
VRTKKVDTLEKKKLLREDRDGGAAVLVSFFLEQIDGEHMRRRCAVSSFSKGFLIDFCPFVALFVISVFGYFLLMHLPLKPIFFSLCSSVLFMRRSLIMNKGCFWCCFYFILFCFHSCYE